MKAALLLLAAQVFAARGGQQDVRWQDLKIAKAMAQDGKLVLVYVACDPGSGKMG